MNNLIQSDLFKNKNYAEASVFLPENLLREARRQKNIALGQVPKICILDPDGDLTQHLVDSGRATVNPFWACYHSKLYDFKILDYDLGILPCIVGAPYAVLVAEQLFVSGCQLIISVTSAGIISSTHSVKKYALIVETIRDEGTSHHYLHPAISAQLNDQLYNLLVMQDHSNQNMFFPAKSWTTDAPYRETVTAISAMKQNGVTCVEMEAAALYAYALAKQKNIVCFAHLTNTMAQQEGDFEKGENSGSHDALALLSQVVTALAHLLI